MWYKYFIMFAVFCKHDSKSLSRYSYRSWKTWKVMEFKNFVFQAWNVMEFNYRSLKVMENQSFVR